MSWKKKLGVDVIQTVRGLGYCLEKPGGGEVERAG